MKILGVTIPKWLKVALEALLAVAMAVIAVLFVRKALTAIISSVFPSTAKVVNFYRGKDKFHIAIKDPSGNYINVALPKDSKGKQLVYSDVKQAGVSSIGEVHVTVLSKRVDLSAPTVSADSPMGIKF